MVIGGTKNPDKNKLMTNFQPQSVQSQSNIISCLSLYNYQATQQSAKNRVKDEDVPKLSAIAQEVKQGYVAEIHEALVRNETDSGEKKQSCILPSDFELKKASEMSLKDINFKLMSTAKSVSHSYF